jgi:hypothetical protein
MKTRVLLVMPAGLLMVFIGCRAREDMPGAGAGSPSQKTEKAYVEVLMGKDNFDKAAPQLVPAKTVKLKGELAWAGSRDKRVVVHLAGIYTGSDPAVTAVILTKDAVTDRAAAETKYKRDRYPSDEIIIEGVIKEVKPNDYLIILAGFEG